MGSSRVEIVTDYEECSCTDLHGKWWAGLREQGRFVD
jgi:hypothetical protein